MGRHNNQITGVFFGRGDDGIGNHIRLAYNRFACDAFGRGRFFNSIDNRLAVVCPLRLDAFDFFNVEHNAALEIADRVGWNNLKNHQLRLALLRKFHGLGHRSFGQLGAIGRD